MKGTHSKVIIRIVCLILIILSSLNYAPAVANDMFKSLTLKDGLAHTDANCVAQDSTGLIWIGTNSGLQNYDGYQLRTIDYYPPNQKIYQSHNRINSIECGNSRLWIGSDSGLACLDLTTHLYIPYTIVANDPTVFNQRIVCLYLDNKSNYLWVKAGRKFYAARIEEATNTIYLADWENEIERDSLSLYPSPILFKGYAWVITNSALTQLEIKNNKIRIREKYSLNSILKPNTSITSLAAHTDNLYLRSTIGCYRIPFANNAPDMKSFAYMYFDQINTNIPSETQGTFIVDSNETLWCSYFGGIFEVKHPFTSYTTIKQYLGNSKNVNSSLTKITSLFIDQYNNLWIATMDRGLYYYALTSPLFHHISNRILEDTGLSQNTVTAIAVHEKEALWMIMEGASLVRYDIKTETAKCITMAATKGAADGLQTVALSKDQKVLYVGSMQGLIAYEINSGKSHWIQGCQGRSICKIREDKWGRLWLATWGEGVFCIQNPMQNTSIIYHFSPRTQHPILSYSVTDLQIDDHSITVGNMEGLNKIWLNEKGELKSTSAYCANPDSPHSLSSDYIASIDKENDSTLWVGTIGGGVNKVTIHSTRDNDYSAVVYTTTNGLTNNDSEIVFFDKNQNVWIGGKGIACLNTKTNKISIHESGDGLSNNSFKIGADAKSENGTIYMGGIEGLYYFNPESITSQPSYQRANLIFNNLYINNQIIISNTTHEGHIPLSKILNQTQKLNLTYNQNNFTISFSALGYNFSNQIMYRYRLSGFEKEWHVIPITENTAYYSNLSHGDYLFELQISTDRGVTWETPGRTLAISILPPLWLTGWAKLIYFILSIGIIAIIAYQYHKEQRLKRENHIQELQRINDEERYQAKMRFFMNISHELRTPLTLIMLAAEKLAESRLSKECATILTNCRNMLSLITELVDIRKAELGLNQIKVTRQSISELINQLYMEIGPWAEKKNIIIEYLPPREDIEMDFDRDKIGKLVINLLSNAIKYTPQGGHVQLILKVEMPEEITPLYANRHKEGEVLSKAPVCILIIQDSGIGISAESIKKIYERFFQVKNNNADHLGSGIGLAIAKSMVLLHQGSITVSSERNKGTEFIVALPLSNGITEIQENNQTPDILPETFNAKEFIDTQYMEHIPSGETNDLTDEYETKKGIKEDCPTLLIVEDNVELQTALKEYLSPYYNIKMADNGQAGLELCETIYPDIIISDIMMPEMDGIEMCKRIRNNLSIAYIPIILLTAKADVENQIEGYESGADLYMPKPFSTKLLEVNLKRLLAQKNRWFTQEKPKETFLPEKKGYLEDENRKFIEQIKQLVEENMTNPHFSVEFLCNELNMGRTKLYNKIKETSEQPLADYIRNLRLEKAAYLIINSSMNINEIITEVGFNNGSHFSRIFKLKYGVPPTDYKKVTV